MKKTGTIKGLRPRGHRINHPVPNLRRKKMNITIKINTDNAAFNENIGAMEETARILRDLANKIQSGIVDLESGASYKLRDANGNVVGTYEVKS